MNLCLSQLVWMTFNYFSEITHMQLLNILITGKGGEWLEWPVYVVYMFFLSHSSNFSFEWDIFAILFRLRWKDSGPNLRINLTRPHLIRWFKTQNFHVHAHLDFFLRSGQWQVAILGTLFINNSSSLWPYFYRTWYQNKTLICCLETLKVCWMINH